jgi:hypothetical protein
LDTVALEDTEEGKRKKSVFLTLARVLISSYFLRLGGGYGGLGGYGGIGGIGYGSG